MAAKDFAEIDTGFPIYGLRFVNNHTLFACGGGGEGANGIPNKVTAVRCSFTVSDKSRRLQKFREITLPTNEDSPMCVEFCRSSNGDNSRYSIFVGCNQSTELIRSMNINNNLRKYNYTDDEHLQFLDAVQFDDSLSVESIGEYPKIVHISSDSSVGGMMTSRIPSEIFIFNPETLELNTRFKPSSPSEIKDFHLNPVDGGKTLTYVTASFIETISTNSGNLMGSSSTTDKKTAKTLGKYFFSKVRYVDGSKVIITAALRSGRGAAVLEYDTETRKVTKERVVSTKIKGIVAIDISNTSGLCAVAGNDFSVSLLRLTDLKIVKTYKKLHKFAVTCLSFSPDGKKLATGSASNTLNVLLVKPSSGGFFSFLYSLFRFVFFSILIAFFAFYVQQMHESGDLNQYIELSKTYGAKALVHAQHYQEVGLELSQKYGKEYYEIGQYYGKIGYGIAKEQAFKGLEFAKEQINERRAAKKEAITTASSLPEWATQDIERTSTIDSDMVKQTTRDIHHLTHGKSDIDTMSIIREATKMLSSNTFQATASPSSTIETSQVTIDTPQDSADILSDAIRQMLDSKSSVASESVIESSSPSEVAENTVSETPLASHIEEITPSASVENTIDEPVQAETGASLPEQALESTESKGDEVVSHVIETKEVAQEPSLSVANEVSHQPSVKSTESLHVPEPVNPPVHIDTSKLDVEDDAKDPQSVAPVYETREVQVTEVQAQYTKIPDSSSVEPTQFPSSDVGNDFEESQETSISRHEGSSVTDSDIPTFSREESQATESVIPNFSQEESQATESVIPNFSQEESSATESVIPTFSQDEALVIESKISDASSDHPGHHFVDDSVSGQISVETTSLAVESSVAEHQVAEVASSAVTPAVTPESVQLETFETPATPAPVESIETSVEGPIFHEAIEHMEQLTVKSETSESSPEPLTASDPTFVETENIEPSTLATSVETPNEETGSRQQDAEIKDNSYVEEVHVAEISRMEKAPENVHQDIVSEHPPLHVDSDVASTVEIMPPSSEETHAIHDEL